MEFSEVGFYGWLVLYVRRGRYHSNARKRTANHAPQVFGKFPIQVVPASVMTKVPAATPMSTRSM
jgi:hypothetical protein